MTAVYRDRLRSLQTADRAVGRLLDALADTGRLENAYQEADPVLIGKLESRLDALEDCAGQGCRDAEDGP